MSGVVPEIEEAEPPKPEIEIEEIEPMDPSCRAAMLLPSATHTEPDPEPW